MNIVTGKTQPDEGEIVFDGSAEGLHDPDVRKHLTL